MRILFTSITSEIGGADLALLAAVRNLSRPEFQPIVGLPCDGPLVAAFRAAGAEVRFVPMRRLKNTLNPLWHLGFLWDYRASCCRLAEIARSEGADLIHSNTLPNVYGARAAKLAGLPHVWEVRELDLRPKAVRAALVFLARRNSAHVVCMSGSIATGLFGREWRKEPISVIYGAVDLGSFQPASTAPLRLRGRYRLPPDAKVAGIWCRFDEWKGLPVAIRAAGLLAKEIPRFRLLVAGGATAGHERYAEKLRKLAQKVAPDSVIFTDWLSPEETPAFVAGLDVAVHASTRPEPFGLVIAEAMSCGTPLVAPRLGSPLELVENEIDGLLYEAGKPEALAAAVRRFFDEPELREKCARAGRAKAERLFDIKKNVRQLEDIYRNIAGRRAP